MITRLWLSQLKKNYHFSFLFAFPGCDFISPPHKKVLTKIIHSKFPIQSKNSSDRKFKPRKSLRTFPLEYTYGLYVLTYTIRAVTPRFGTTFPIVKKFLQIEGTAVKIDRFHVMSYHFRSPYWCTTFDCDIYH